MFAAHLAAGLAIGVARPRVPAWATLTGAFLPDLLWIGLAGAGVEPADPAVFFDGWSHSAASIVVQAVIAGLCFARAGRGVALAVAAAVLSHFPLDALIHPRPLEVWPHAAIAFGRPDWDWGEATLALGRSRYWWVQAAVTAPLLAWYAARARAPAFPRNLVAASVVLVAGLHLIG